MMSNPSSKTSSAFQRRIFSSPVAAAVIKGLSLLSLALVVQASSLSPISHADSVLLEGGIETLVTMDEVSQDSSKGKGIVGLDLAIRSSRYPVVRDVFRYSPAHFVGIRPGDTVLAVNGETVKGWSSAEVDDAISDIPGTAVTITIQRGENTRNLTLTVTSLADAHPELKRYFLSYSH